MDHHSALPSTGPDDAGKPVTSALSSPADAPPAHLGRYRVEKLLGQGSFGRVYLAYDEPLRRLVAVKVPRPDRAAPPGYADAYLAEARIPGSKAAGAAYYPLWAHLRL